MTRRKVDSSHVERALEMRDEGHPVAEILKETGLSQGTYYSYVHRREDEIERRYRDEEIAPLLTWPGSKRRELKRILQYVPKRFGGRYIEPFVGAGALFWYLKPEAAILSDMNPELISFYGEVRDRYRRLHRELKELECEYGQLDDKGKRAFYKHIRDVMNNKATGVSVPAAFYIVNHLSNSGLMRFNKSGEFNMSGDPRKKFHADAVSPLHVRALRDVELMSCDFEEVFGYCKGDDFVFCDPPYDNSYANYGSIFGEDEHRRLAYAFKHLPCPALMVVSRTQLTTELYGDDVIEEYSFQYNENVSGKVTTSNVHMFVGRRL